MIDLVSGAKFDEDNGRILFTRPMDVLSTCGTGASKTLRGISFGKYNSDMLALPCFGSTSSIRTAVVGKGTAKVAAVAFANLGGGHMRIGDVPGVKDGCISLVVIVDARLPEYSAARATVTVTEGITAVMREFGLGKAGCSTSTGSAVEEIAIVSPSESDLFLTGTGKHSVLGECIGRSAMEAVRSSAIANGIPEGTRPAMERLNMGPVEDTEMSQVMLALLQLRDEVSWGFIPEDVGLKAARDIVSLFTDTPVEGDSVDSIAKVLTERI